MKQKTPRAASAFTRIELAVVIVIVGLLAAASFPMLLKRTSAAQRVSCLNNLLEIGTAYRLWSEDNGNRNPAEQTVAKGGWGDFLTNADQGAICWTNYAIMSNELGQSPRIVICPVDERRAAANFDTDFKDNTHLSYFVGVSANDTYPQSIQGGDRNLGVGIIPDPDYGYYSPKNGKGKDSDIPTNSLKGPVSWSLKMHSSGNVAGAGDILLGDGSTQRTTSASFRTNWLSHAQPTTNWPAGHVPASPSIRLVFP
jgi:type II secretory pathway pseudopilin PulG